MSHWTTESTPAALSDHHRPLLSSGYEEEEEDSFKTTFNELDVRNNVTSDDEEDDTTRLWRSNSSQDDSSCTSRVASAAFLIRDALLLSVASTALDGAGRCNLFSSISGESTWRRNVSVWCGRLLVWGGEGTVTAVSSMGLILLSFLEPPPWCRHSSLASGGEGCAVILKKRGIAAFYSDPTDINDIVDYYPNSGVAAILSLRQSLFVESVCLSFIILHVLFTFGRDGLSIRRYFYLAPTTTTNHNQNDTSKEEEHPARSEEGMRGVARHLVTARIMRVIRLTSILGLLLCMAVGEQHPFRTFAVFWRLVLFVTFSQGLQQEITTVVRMLLQLGSILFLLVVTVVLYSWIGVVAFHDSVEGNESFPSLVEGMWTLFDCITISNYPDLMMGAYNENRITALYFISFMIVTFFFLMKVLLASVVNAYNNESDLRKEESRETSLKYTKMAFRMLDVGGIGYIDRTTIMAIFRVLNDECPEIRPISNDRAEILFAILDKNGSSQVSEDEFMNFGTVLDLEFESYRTYISAVEYYFPEFSKSDLYEKFCAAIKSETFEVVIDIILVLNAAVVVIQSYSMLIGENPSRNPYSANGMIDTPWEYAETLFTVIYCLELVAKVTVLGWKRYCESLRYLLDAFITVLSLVATCYVNSPRWIHDGRATKYIVIARVLRVTRVIIAIKEFRVIGRTFIDIFPAAKRITMFLFCIMYIFSAAGMHAFGGKITRDPANPLSARLAGTDFAANEYWANNFNDMLSGLNVLFNLFVMSNWPGMADGLAAVTGSKTSRYFSLSFYIIGVVLVNNSVVAFVIDSFMQEWKNRYKPKENAIDTGEAIVARHQRAYFNAREITGTKTSLSEDYVARLREGRGPNRDGRSIEDLFTRSNSRRSST